MDTFRAGQPGTTKGTNMGVKRWSAMGVLLVAVLLTGITSPALAQAQNARRIQFAPGGTSATVQGQVAASGSDTWVVRALAGQTLSAQLAFTSGEAILVIWGADGEVLMTDHAEASGFSGVLPSTQDYFIAVRGNPSTSTAYALTVSVPPITGTPTVKRIRFTPS